MAEALALVKNRGKQARSVRSAPAATAPDGGTSAAKPCQPVKALSEVVSSELLCDDDDEDCLADLDWDAAERAAVASASGLNHL